LEVNFKTKKLQKQFENHKEAFRAYGQDVGKKYIMRVVTLQRATSFDDLCKITSLHFHPLKGNRKGEYAITLVGKWRLIITNDGDEFDIAKVEEVSDHYGD